MELKLIKPINPNCKKIDRAVLSIGYEKSGKKGLIEILSNAALIHSKRVDQYYPII